MKQKNRFATAVILALIISATVCFLISAGALAWSMDDPELKGLIRTVTVRDYDYNMEMKLSFVYMTEEAVSHIFGAKMIETFREQTNNRNCFLLSVWAYQDVMFFPSSIAFVQENLQYEVDFNDIVRITPTFSGRLRKDTNVAGFILLPEQVDMTKRMKIYYDEDWISFNLPEQTISIEEKIAQLKKNKGKLLEELVILQDRIDKLDKELASLEEQLEEKQE